MCWVCDADKLSIANSYWAGRLGLGSLHLQSAVAGDLAPAFTLSDWGDRLSLGSIDSGATGKLVTALPFDGVGDKAAVATAAPTLLVVTPDDIANDTSTTTTIAVDGDHIISTINTVGDLDFVKVDLVAGRTYDIGQYLVVGGPSGTPLADAYIELYDASGDLIVSADGGGPNTPSGLDALLTYTAQQSGTYYINARAYDQDSSNGTDGDGVGDYDLFVNDVTGRPSYQPYYQPDSPLHALDWGSQVDRTSRNPDGAEGPRDTGNAFTGVGSNPFGIEGKNVITVYFAKAGDIFVAEDPTSPGLTDTMVAKGFSAWEKDAFFTALEQFENVADVVYVEVDNRNEADFKFVTYVGTPGHGPSLLGRMSPPNEQNEGQAEFNANDKRWTEEGLQPGAFSYVTLIHELGHGMGMAHPHDNGGRSSIMRGVEEEAAFDYTTGDFELNQGVFTMMSYEDGWQSSPYGNASTTAGHGYLMGLSAFDIAVIQDKYGVNEEFATGDDTYTLKDVNASGTGFRAIWDAGGTDAIVYDGARDTTIDLRAATLEYEYGGGGNVSYAYGVFGGFTVANGVTIENATSGAGNDTLIGNDAANALSGGAGNDSLSGGGGADILIGGLGTDSLNGGDGADVFRFESAGDSTVGSGRDKIVDFVQGSDLIDLTALGAANFVGTSAFSGKAGQVRYAAFAGATIVELDQDGDGDTDFQLELAGGLPLSVDDFVNLADALGATNGDDTLTGTAGNDVLNGRGGNDTLRGLAGNDILIGGAGADRLTGGAGSDVFVLESAGDSPIGGRDVITDFVRGSDRIDLSGIDAISGTAGDDAFAFVGRAAFSGTAGELRYARSGGNTFLEGDIDGDALPDFQVMLAGGINLVQTDFIV